MGNALSEKIIELIGHARGRYQRLILIVGYSDSDKKGAFEEVVERAGARYINVNLELSERLLELTERQRALNAAEILGEIASDGDPELIILDKTELLFESSLELNPLACLQKVSKNRTVIASWNGKFEGGYLIYAEPGHPEYFKDSVKDLLIITGG